MRKNFGLLLVAVVIVASVGIDLWLDEMNKVNIPQVVEIREYEGNNLSSINDFRENSIEGTQYIDKDEYSLLITGLVNRDITYTYEQVINHQVYKKVVTLYCVEGWVVTILWEGVSVKDLIIEAGLDPRANTVILHAQDGYTTSMPLDYIIENNIILAHKMNNVTLPSERGFPFQLVSESKWGYKWIKWVTVIELSDDPEHRGYWESRGYSNDASLNGNFSDK